MPAEISCHPTTLAFFKPTHTDVKPGSFSSGVYSCADREGRPASKICIHPLCFHAAGERPAKEDKEVEEIGSISGGEYLCFV